MKSIFFILFLFCLSSCHLLSYKQKPDVRFTQIIKSSPDINSKLLYNGLYSLVKIDSSYSISDSLGKKNDCYVDPIMVYSNGIIDYIGEIYITNIEKRIKYIKKKNLHPDLPFGVYRVNDEMIEASIYLVFEGNGDSFNIWYLCNFTGEIDGSKIINWRMIPPFPNFTRLEKRQNYNQEKMKYLTQAKDFEFKPFIQKTLLDSNSVWLNKFREK